jgi:L-ascorbate metabolism protein UlaG (beta-lactamase superfamily)
MTWIILIIILLLSFAVIILIGWKLSSPRYKGPVSDHFDGKRFYNRGGVEVKGFKDFLKWIATRKRVRWKKIDAPTGPPPPQRAGKGELIITFINHCTFLIQVDGMNIITDPIWSERASPLSWAGPKRMRPPGIRIEDLPPIDIMILSHDHYDHLDEASVKKIAAMHNPRVYTSLGVKAVLEKIGITNVAEMDWHDVFTIDNDLAIICVPAQHFSARGMFDRNATLWSGFVIRSQHGNIYFAADTGYGSFIKEEIGDRYAPLRASILPIGAYRPEWFMQTVHVSPEESVQIHKEIRSHNSIASHFGTFPLADEGMYEPVEALIVALEKQGIPQEKFIALKEGKNIYIKPIN